MRARTQPHQPTRNITHAHAQTKVPLERCLRLFPHLQVSSTPASLGPWSFIALASRSATRCRHQQGVLTRRRRLDKVPPSPLCQGVREGVTARTHTLTNTGNPPLARTQARTTHACTHARTHVHTHVHTHAHLFRCVKRALSQKPWPRIPDFKVITNKAVPGLGLIGFHCAGYWWLFCGTFAQGGPARVWAHAARRG